MERDNNELIKSPIPGIRMGVDMDTIATLSESTYSLPMNAARLNLVDFSLIKKGKGSGVYLRKPENTWYGGDGKDVVACMGECGEKY